MQNSPNSSYVFAVPVSTSVGLSFATINNLEYSKIFEIYFNHQGVIAELVYGRIIQRWYDFLNQIIEEIVKESITGIKNYPNIPKIYLNIIKVLFEIKISK